MAAGKNISIYVSDENLKKLDYLKEVFEKEDLEDGWYLINRSRSDMFNLALNYFFNEFQDKFVDYK